MFERIILCCAFIFLIHFAGVSDARCQSLREEYTLRSASDSVLFLPDAFLMLSTLELRLDSTLTLRQGVDYEIIDTGISTQVILLPSLRLLLFGESLSGTTPERQHHIRMLCTVFHTSLRRSYSLLKSDSKKDSSLGSDATLLTLDNLANASSSNNDHFRFRKSGGITRGIQVGSSQDATFNNSFNLTFDGALGDALDFKGALSEESTPLQPEGNTQTLRDIDRIYIELHSPHLFTATIGDFPLSLNHIRQDSLASSSLYDNISRKVLGAMAAVQTGPTAVAASYSITKGQFTTNAIPGIDGVQGPYTLTGKNGEQAIIVIAGTEHVYVDGVLLTRGDQYDYVIDYGLAQITFTSKRIITSFSRISVDFEYTNEQYSRDLVAVKQSTSLFSDRLSITTTYLREGDDPNNPRDLSLSDSDKVLLASAGNDPSKATKSGVVLMAKDSNGRVFGNYRAIDTTIGTNTVRIYEYAPFDTIHSSYNIAFGFAGTAKGQYTRKSIGDYEYVGQGNGDYDTLVFLPFPQLHQLFGGGLHIRPIDGLDLNADAATSSLTVNRFSSVDAMNAGAYTISGNYNDTVSKSNHGYIGMFAKQSFTAAAFAPFDRIRSVESMRAYGIDNTTSGTTQLGADEREQLIDLHSSFSNISAGFTFGGYSLGGNTYTAKRYEYALAVDGRNSDLPDLSIHYRVTPTSDSASDAASTWRILSTDLSKTMSDSGHSFMPRLSFSFADRKSTPLNVGFSGDSLLGSSFRYIEFAPSIRTRLGSGATLNASYTYRSDDSVRNGSFRTISHSSQLLLSSSLTLNNGFSGQFDMGLHARSITDSVSRIIDGGNNTSLLLHLVPRYQSGRGAISVSADYQVSELRTASLQRLFFAVPAGQGNYTYTGDLNLNGKQDPDEFQPARFADQGTYILLTIPTDQLQPTVDLHSQFRLRVSPASLDSDNVFHFFSPFSFETIARFDENSTDHTTSDIYLLRLSHFLNDSSTIKGVQELQQDIFVFENNQNLSFRLRWNQLKGASQYNTGLERFYHRETSLRSRIRLADEWTTESNVHLSNDNVATTMLSTNRPQQTTRYSADARLSYDPFGARTGYSLVASYESIADPMYLTSSHAAINSLLISMRYAITSKLTLRLEIGRNEFVAHTVDDQLLPYGISSGLLPGLTWQWSIGADQEISRGVLLNVSYDGRSEPSFPMRHITHTARAEIRASF